MGILGINNRTENWKTVRTLSPPLSGKAKSKLVKRLLKDYLDYPDVEESGKIKFELFWRGVRDWENSGHHPEPDYAKAYLDLFGGLRDDIEQFDSSKALKDWNYQVSENICVDDKTPSTEVLRRNLFYTEIDIVLQTRRHLFIGEAKDESRLDGTSKYVLAHQLIRQYVTAKVLVRMMGERHCVVPFIVASDVKSVRKQWQTRFMIDQCWLRKSNVLSWDDIKNLLEVT